MIYNIFKGLTMLKEPERYNMTSDQMHALFRELADLSINTVNKIDDVTDEFVGSFEELNDMLELWEKMLSKKCIIELLEGTEVERLVDKLREKVDELYPKDTECKDDDNFIMQLTIDEISAAQNMVYDYMKYVERQIELSPELKATVEMQLMNYTAFTILNARKDV